MGSPTFKVRLIYFINNKMILVPYRYFDYFISEVSLDREAASCSWERERENPVGDSTREGEGEKKQILGGKI